MSDVDLPPVPAQTPVVGGKPDLISYIWANWLRKLAQIVMDASQIDAASAAADAEASASQAESYSSSAASQATSAATSAAAAALSEGNASGSSTSAALSAASAAASAAEAAGLVAEQTFSPYLIGSTITVPAGTQMITFDQVTLQSAGRLIINGRGRIL